MSMFLRIQITALIYLVVFYTSTTFADGKKNSETLKPKNSTDIVITDKEWLKAFGYNFKEEFCNSKEIQICYDRITPTCMEFVHVQLGQCFKNARLPKSAPMDKRYPMLGAKIGRCVGREVNKRFLKKKVTESICQNLL